MRFDFTTAILLGGFIGVIAWFGTADVYNTHFFDAGPIVLTYNLFRIAFACYLTWIIYITGIEILSLWVLPKDMRQFSLAERAVLAFGTGVGFWHVLLLILGISGLYYRSLMITLCLVVLAVSGKHLEGLVDELRQRVRDRVTKLPRVQIIGGFILMLAAIWLLLVRGLYPGGAGDYFTHYYYYYQEVVRNHGLQPNDVWYHFYYSKGAGLFFLGILLTDPEAPQLVTFSMVAFAALGLTTLTARMAPRSLWPMLCGALYLLSYMGLGGSGGEFQKLHEEMGALVVLAAWISCMYSLRPCQWERPCLVAGMFVIAGATILTHAIGVFLAIYFALRAALAFARRSVRQMLFFGSLCGAALGVVIILLLINYLMTGLASDQALDWTARFVNVKRLDEWGVLPLIVVVAWIRDNYDSLAPVYGWPSLAQLGVFLRLDALWVLVGSGGVALVAALTVRAASSHDHGSRLSGVRSGPAGQSDFHLSAIRKILVSLSLLIGTWAMLSVFAGHTQAVSYTRFSTFFFPLVTILATTCWLMLGAECVAALRWTARIAVPITLLIAVPLSWPNLFAQLKLVTGNALLFAVGRYSLAGAYSNQDRGHPFGGINPGALAAMRQVPPGSRIWSTNVDSYCMVPNCRIESVVSFKMSPRSNDILNGSPEQARRILEEEGLNYFLFSKSFHLLDLLPYSKLFSPRTIAENLGIKWTDGETYLLTWRGADTAPIEPDFIRAYSERYHEAEHPWFRFSKVLTHIDKVTEILYESRRQPAVINFPWQRQSNESYLIEATYGRNCWGLKLAFPWINSVPSGNMTGVLREACSNKLPCNFPIHVGRLGDPAPGCPKDFRVTYRCPSEERYREVALIPEAHGKVVNLDCETDHRQ